MEAALYRRSVDSKIIKVIKERVMERIADALENWSCPENEKIADALESIADALRGPSTVLDMAALFALIDRFTGFCASRNRAVGLPFEEHFYLWVISTPTVDESEPDIDMDAGCIFLCPSQYALLRGAPIVALERWFQKKRFTEWSYASGAQGLGAFRVKRVRMDFTKDGIKMDLCVDYK